MCNEDPIWDHCSTKIIKSIIESEPNVSTNQDLYNFIIEHYNDREFFVKALGEPDLSPTSNTLTSIIAITISRLRELK